MGHQGLPVSPFAPQDQREALMAVFAATVHSHGLALTRLADVARGAGVPIEIVASFWPSEVDCLLDTVAAFTHRLFARVATAFMDAAGDGPHALHRAIEALLYEMAAAPDMTYLSTVELPGLGPLVHERHARMLDLFGELLHPALAALDDPPPHRDIVALCIGGGLWEAVRRHALGGRLHRLPDALPAISYVCLSNLFGADEAMRVAHATASRGIAGRRRTRLEIAEAVDFIRTAPPRSPTPRPTGS